MTIDVLIAAISTMGVVFGAGFWAFMAKSKEVSHSLQEELKKQKALLVKGDQEQMARFRDSILADNRSLMALVDDLRRELVETEKMYAEARAQIVILEARVTALEKELHAAS